MLDDRYDPRHDPRVRKLADEGPGGLVSALLGDFADLMQKEIALAKGELQKNVMDKIRGAVWMAVAGVLLLVMALTLVGAVVLLIASYGFALHLAAFMVAGALLVIGLAALMAGRAKMSGDMAPTRSMTQVRQDIRTVKEQMQ